MIDVPRVRAPVRAHDTEAVWGDRQRLSLRAIAARFWQRLAGVSLSLSAAANGRELAEQTAARDALATASAETRQTMRELRTLLVDIYPPTLLRSGLSTALNDLVAPLRAAGMETRVAVPATPELPYDTEALFYRVAQEALRNARAHGEATAVSVSVERRDDEAELTVTDNGRGFSQRSDDDAGEPGHFGLRLMRDLADHAGGSLDVHSTVGAGTSVKLVVPLR